MPTQHIDLADERLRNRGWHVFCFHYRTVDRQADEVVTLPNSSVFQRKLDWNLFKTFAEIVRAGGVSKAARCTNRQQPALSSALKRFEDHLEVTLCNRGPSGFHLTDQGSAVAEICFEFERQIGLLVERLDEITHGPPIQLRMILVSNLVSSRLDRAIASFSQHYSRAELRISIAPCPDIEGRILEHEAEIGIAPLECCNPRLISRPLYREQNIVVCGRPHALYGKVITEPQELAKEAFILPGTDEPTPVRAYRERYGWGRVSAGESQDLNEVRRLVAAGLGIAVLPQEFLQADLDSGRLARLMPAAPELQDDICLIANPANPRFSAVQKFLALIPEEQ
jgi:DNA-binding transcriptional LysR family regulator